MTPDPADIEAVIEVLKDIRAGLRPGSEVQVGIDAIERLVRTQRIAVDALRAIERRYGQTSVPL
jgi:hypothetical protein